MMMVVLPSLLKNEQLINRIKEDPKNIFKYLGTEQFRTIMRDILKTVNSRRNGFLLSNNITFEDVNIDFSALDALCNTNDNTASILSALLANFDLSALLNPPSVPSESPNA